MSHQVETMAYANEVPWHGLGVKVEDNLTPKEILKAADLDWKVSRQPTFLKDGTEVPEINALVRDKDNSILGPCGKKYQPIQNDDAFSFFDKFTKAGDMKMETAGSLDHGRKVWALAKLKEGFTLKDKDEVQGYLLLVHPHIWGKSLQIMFTPVRVVCNNTLTFALQGAGQDNRFRVIHNKAFDQDVKLMAEEALGLSSDAMKDFKAQAQLLSKKKADMDTVLDYYIRLVQPTLLNDQENEDEYGRTLKRLLHAYEVQPGLDKNEGTWWTALNGLTYFVDHIAATDADKRMNSAWFGARANLKKRGLKLAMELSEAA